MHFDASGHTQTCVSTQHKLSHAAQHCVKWSQYMKYISEWSKKTEGRSSLQHRGHVGNCPRRCPWCRNVWLKLSFNIYQHTSKLCTASMCVVSWGQTLFYYCSDWHIWFSLKQLQAHLNLRVWTVWKITFALSKPKMLEATRAISHHCQKSLRKLGSRFEFSSCHPRTEITPLSLQRNC